ncbi:MAG TPA: hypothetical protein VFO55_15145 [Gemmatimonadaceae bacterium]|nr:hypothetical protein [Gemmatimonadaceae bacterium]
MTWNLPLPDNDAMSIGVTTFLPSGVDPVGSPATAFSATVASLPPITRMLGAQCASCPSGTAPKPAFSAPVASTTVTLTAGTQLTSAVLATGSQLVVTLNNGFTFDPINPPGGSPGIVTLAVLNGATTLGTLTLQGGSQTIPAGQAKNFTIALAGTINTASPITVTMTMDSPAGSAAQPVAMNPTTDAFTASATPTINISSATVSIGAQPVTASPTPLDLSQIDSSVVRRIVDDNQNRGTMFLTVTNPLTIGASTTITFRSPTGTPAADQIVPVTKNVVIPAAANATTPNVSTIPVSLTGQELRRIFGRDVEVVFGGTTQAGSTTVTPTQRISVSSRIQVNFTVKEQTP